MHRVAWSGVTNEITAKIGSKTNGGRSTIRFAHMQNTLLTPNKWCLFCIQVCLQTDNSGWTPTRSGVPQPGWPAPTHCLVWQQPWRSGCRAKHLRMATRTPDAHKARHTYDRWAVRDRPAAQPATGPFLSGREHRRLWRCSSKSRATWLPWRGRYATETTKSRSPNWCAGWRSDHDHNCYDNDNCSAVGYLLSSALLERIRQDSLNSLRTEQTMSRNYSFIIIHTVIPGCVV